MHMTLIKRGKNEMLLIEHHDISVQKETEARLKRVQESTHEMLAMIEKEKEHLTRSIESNLELVTFPLISQLRISATIPQKEILDLLESRIKHVTRDLSITTRTGTQGANLTRRQILICEMIRDGMTSKQIASALDCAPSTINNHRNTIRQRLGLAGETVNLQAFLNRVDES